MKISVLGSSNRIIALLSVYFLVVFNVRFWLVLAKQAPLLYDHNMVLWLAMPIFLLAAMNVFIQLFFWPYVHKVVVPVLLMVGAAVSYAAMTQDVYFNADMMQNVLQTNMGEAGAWLSAGFLWWCLVTGVLPSVGYVWVVRLVYAHPWYREVVWRLLNILMSVVVAGAVVLAAYGHFASFFRNNKQVNHQIAPTNVVGALFKTAYNAYDASRPLQRIGLDAQHQAHVGGRKRVLILVVGETTRAENWGLNGYARQTTPQLAAMGSDIVNFPQVASCGTSTAVSVPCLFSNMPRAHYDANRARHQEGLMDVLQRAGISTLWRENDGGCKGACDRIRHVEVRDWAPKQECVGDGCQDLNLLTHLQQEIRALPTDGVIVLHTMGSHGPAYYQRYPSAFRRFMPTCDTNQIQSCDNQQLRNTYDNTVLYVDHMLAQTIRLLQSETNVDAALWYFSDHGESLGENGMYLHAAPYAIAPSQQTHIPMIFWANAGFYHDAGLDASCLQRRAQQTQFSHDDVFHSTLGLMDVRTHEYQPELDVFRPCRAH